MLDVRLLRAVNNRMAEATYRASILGSPRRPEFVGRMRGVIPRIATISDDCFLPRGCSFRMLPRSRLRHDPGWLFLGFRRGCRECLRRWRLHGDRRLRDRGSGRNDRSFHDRHRCGRRLGSDDRYRCGRRLWSDDCYRCGERLGGGNCDVLDRCLGLREPIEGNSESQIDAEPASDDCEEARKNRTPRLSYRWQLIFLKGRNGLPSLSRGHRPTGSMDRPAQHRTPCRFAAGT